MDAPPGVVAGYLRRDLVSVSSACRNSLAGYAVYIWHCDRDGKYSMHSSGTTNQSYLRGIQVFSGGTTYQVVTPSGNTTSGYVATLNVGL